MPTIQITRQALHAIESRANGPLASQARPAQAPNMVEIDVDHEVLARLDVARASAGLQVSYSDILLAMCQFLATGTAKPH